MKICVVISSGGSVVKEALKLPSLQNSIYSIVTDRVCNAQTIAHDYNIRLKEIRTKNNLLFSDSLLEYCKIENIDYIFSFHVRLYEGKLLINYRNRIINFHLSILPSFPGFNSFENALIHGVKVLGTTVHFIDESIDMGIPILQSVLPNDPSVTIEKLRHLLFIQQCKSFIQVIYWINENRIQVTNKVCVVVGSVFNNREFMPALDNEFAMNFHK